MTVVAFFGLKGGQGKTTLAHHLTWMFSDLDVRVVAADLDPQGDLTQRFLGMDRTAELREEETVYGSLKGLLGGDIAAGEPHIVAPGDRVGLLAGGIALWSLASVFEEAWTLALAGDIEACVALTAVRRLLKAAGERHGAPLVVVDLAPGLGPLNRAVLAAADHLVIPIVPDALSLKALRFTGESLDLWSTQWQARRRWIPDAEQSRHEGARPLGYVVHMLPVYAGRPVTASQHVMRELPAEYGRWIARSPDLGPRPPELDDNCLGVISPMSVLVPTAADANKPVFHLTPADGAIGSTMKAVQRFRSEFESVARNIAGRIDLPLA